MKTQRLETDRLVLRRWIEADVAPFAALCADPDVMRFIGDGSTRTAEEARESIAHYEAAWDAEGFGLFAVERRQTGEMIGFAGLSRPHFLPEILPSVEIGWRFAKPHWRKSYATETSALAFGVDDLKLPAIVSICQLGNTASERIMRKLGLALDRETIDPTCNRAIRVYRLPQV